MRDRQRTLLLCYGNSAIWSVKRREVHLLSCHVHASTYMSHVVDSTTQGVKFASFRMQRFRKEGENKPCGARAWRPKSAAQHELLLCGVFRSHLHRLQRALCLQKQQTATSAGRLSYTRNNAVHVYTQWTYSSKLENIRFYLEYLWKYSRF